jgi:F-box protein, helicase, 18
MATSIQQQAVVDSSGTIKVDSGPGSGKTKTLIDYAKARPDKKMLYLAYNKSMNDEATVRFRQAGCYHVECRTPHSLAYRAIVSKYFKKGTKIENLTFRVVDDLVDNPCQDKQDAILFTKNVGRLIAWWCSTSDRGINMKRYYEEVCGTADKIFLKSWHRHVLAEARKILERIEKGTLPLTHDYYIKRFQLLNAEMPQLRGFDIILFDEAQDASEVMLNTALVQNKDIVFVGDRNQQIYGWRWALNALDKIDAPQFWMTESYRFNQRIADHANGILEMKHMLEIDPRLPIIGKAIGLGLGQTSSSNKQTVIGRTNISILSHALASDEDEAIHFNGGIWRYLQSDDGINLYDVVALRTGKREFIKNDFLLKFDNFNEFREYVELVEDHVMLMMIAVADRYTTSFGPKMKELRNRVVEEEKDSDTSYVSGHRCKGQEWDCVTVLPGFITPEKLKTKIDEGEPRNSLNEEINLYYVAVTRAKKQVVDCNTENPPTTIT